MNKYPVLDDIGLTQNKSEIVECLKLRYKNSDPKCILSIEWLYCIISSQLQIIVYKIHIIHNEQYLILTDLLGLLSNLEIYLDLSTKKILINENKVREKLDDLSTKKLRTKNTVKTSEQLSLSKDLQKDDLEGLRERREATFSTLSAMVTERANTADIMASLRFFGGKIQKTFPSLKCCFNNGDHQQFIDNNIQYTSKLALMMQDCHTFLQENHILKEIIEENNSQSQAFETLNERMSVTIRSMNQHCSTLQELFELKSKLGKQLVKFVKFHWK